MRGLKVTGYECSECGYIHEQESDAEECCQPEVYEVEAFKCSKCGELYDDKEEAVECCK